jgi:hypothetical protein
MKIKEADDFKNYDQSVRMSWLLQQNKEIT